MQNLREEFQGTQQSFCLLWTHSRKLPELSDVFYEKLAEFKGSIRADEAYEIFKVRFDSEQPSRP